jgi:hypothetical protein
VSAIDFQLSNDDEPGSLAPRRLRVTRLGLTVAGKPTVLASVKPPFTGNGWGVGTMRVLLVSRTRGRSIEDIIADQAIAQDGCLSAAVRVRQLRSRPICPAPMSASSSGDDRNDVAVENYDRVQDDLVEARTRLARAIAGAAMSGMTQDEIVDLTGYPADLVLRICRDAGISGD